MATRRAKLTEENAGATINAGGILDRIGRSAADEAAVEVREVPLEQLVANPFQPRRNFPPESVAELAESMRQHGFYGHLLVRLQGERAGRRRATGKQVRYEIAYGERRLRAAKLAGLKTIPVQVRDLSDREMLEIALTENVLREDLHPIDEALGYKRLQDEMNYSVRQIAERIGKSKSYVATLLSLLRYPDLVEAMQTSEIPVRTAEELAKIENESERRYYTAQVMAGMLDRAKLIEERKRQAIRDELARTEPDPLSLAYTVAPVRSADKSAYDAYKAHLEAEAALRRALVALDQLLSRNRPLPPSAQSILTLRQIIDRARVLLRDMGHNPDSPFPQIEPPPKR